ncbi:MAG: ionic transporter y4hA [Candidatus Nanopelagicaceae bacterium]|nr:ionic transporter y4hA [Candidatus Nanopelagicaceae bacterium]
MSSRFKNLRSRYFLLPLGALLVLSISWSMSLSNPILAVLGLLLVATVFTAVHHAEVVALKVGEPFGSLILALSVTVIEVGMIVVLILESPKANQNLARDTVFAAVMITTNGIVGIALLIKALRQRVAIFNAMGVGGALAALAALSTLSLILPSVTTSSPGPTFTNLQLTFAALISLVLYLTFVAVQTVRHRDYFLPPPREDDTIPLEEHVDPPTKTQALQSLSGLLISLVAVVGLAKVTSPLIQGFVDDLGLPQMMVAISIAIVVLLPESISAIKAARYGRTQTSLNLAYGSALASIGLTIPAIAVISILFSYEVNLGLNAAEIVLLALTFFVSTLTVVSGRASLLQSVIHLSIFGSFIMFAATP